MIIIINNEKMPTYINMYDFFSVGHPVHNFFILFQYNNNYISKNTGLFDFLQFYFKYPSCIIKMAKYMMHDTINLTLLLFQPRTCR